MTNDKWVVQTPTLRVCARRPVHPSLLPSSAAPAPSCGLLYILRSLSVIKHSHCTFSQYKVIDSPQTKQNKPTSPQVVPATPVAVTFHHTHQQSSEESPPSLSSGFTTSGSVVTTSSRIATASARAYPLHSAQLTGWTHRLRPTALCACACTQQPHSAHRVRSTAPSHITSPLANH
jgi:hypothetical protein